MFLQFTILLLVISVVSCQINGEFWWLNNDVSNLRRGKAPSPRFDDVNELETDETIKIIFRDNNPDDSENKFKRFNSTEPPKNNTELNVIKFQDKTELAKPLNDINHINVNNKLWNGPNFIKSDLVKKYNSSQKSEDVFQFVFPDDKLLWRKIKNNNKATGTLSSDNKIENLDETNRMKVDDILDNDKFYPENICTFIKKVECIRSRGTLHTPWMKLYKQMSISNEHVICCILPIVPTPMSRIVFPDTSMENEKRHKRSNVDNVSSALNQRNVLMKRKYPTDNQRSGMTTPPTSKKTNQKVVHSDESYTDPYWNIKNPNIRNTEAPNYHDPDSRYDYGSQDDNDDYAVELPKPGLIGLYSDHRQTPTSWLNNPTTDYSYDSVESDEEEIETSYGFSTIDPRLGNRRKSPTKPMRRKPLKLTAESSDPVHDSESQTISYHSYPDFHVLQGFKLMNLMRHKNRFVRGTTETVEKCEKEESEAQYNAKFVNNREVNIEDEYFERNLRQKLYKECGIQLKQGTGKCDNDKEQGIAEFGAHPWILLVVSTKSQQNILCYATLIHARAAVTAAECVRGISPGEISVIAGVLDVIKDLATAQRRMVTAHVHPEYRAGDLANNLALLYWNRPLALDASVQPACLLQSHTEDDCVFVGWGGYDQEMQSELRWQRASILASENCNKRLSKLEVSPSNEAFCAAVESRGTVTGVGGPLLCKNDRRWATVGVAVWRDDVVILLPSHEWVIRTMASLRIQ